MQTNKKASFDIQNYLITFVVLAGLLVTFGSFATEMGNKYNPLTGDTVSSEFQSTYDNLDEVVDTTKDIEDKLMSSDLGKEDSASEFVGGGLHALKLVKTISSTVKSMIINMAVSLGVPSIWVTIGILVIIILIITTFIFMIFKTRG